jgi:hypothetical protein
MVLLWYTMPFLSTLIKSFDQIFSKVWPRQGRRGEGTGQADFHPFEVVELDTKCYKDLRIFVHVMNDSYKTNPFTVGSTMAINALHAIGSGSWNYYSEQFSMKYASEMHGFSQIPVIGEKTRIVIYGYNMPEVKLKVDVAAYLVK